MSVNCSVCCVVVEGDSDCVRCAGNCGSVCHRSCVPQKTRGAKKDWACESCKPDRDTSSLGSNKSVSTTITKEFILNTIEAFKKEIMGKISTENSSLRESLSFLNDAVEENNKLMESVTQELKKTQEVNKQLLKENADLRSNMTSMEIRVRNLEQYSRKQNLEIDGVPESQGEDVCAILADVGRAIGVELKKEKVVAVHRVPTYNKKKSSPIVVKFSTYEERDVWITGYKSVRPLTANKINPSFNGSARVYVNEHLSPENKLLLSKTKEAAKQKGYKYVWSRDGKIFVRRDEGERCKKIDTLLDLDKL